MISYTKASARGRLWLAIAAMSVASGVAAQPAPGPSEYGGAPGPQTQGAFVILPFEPVGSDSCGVAVAPPTKAAAPSLLDALSRSIAKEFSAKGHSVLVDSVEQAPNGAAIVSGCITHVDSGNEAERVVGMGLGASVLTAHVQVRRKTPDGFRPVAQFDLTVKGQNVLPPLGPIGLIVHKVKSGHETLEADAEKLGVKIADRILTEG